MIFNSFTFLLFFLVVFCSYIFLPQKWQNKLLLTASYFFYAVWDYRFCTLLLTTTLVDYTVGLLLARSEQYRKVFLLSSICFNLIILGFFKYFDFFEEGFIGLMSFLDVNVNPLTIHIVLPVGISFYTFQSMSYVIDMYKKEIKPVTSFPDYALYVSFFPQLVAGPIERAKHLLSQIISPRTVSFSGVKIGCYYILCGLFLKVFMADNIARLIDPIFSSTVPQTGVQYLLAGYGFAFQIYGDFAGYSYIAKGLGATLGFDIMNNFNLPYFSQNPQEFWRRWHISLSEWLRDYLYIPLGGSRFGSFRTVRNLMITLLLAGLWHGAKITFVLWGGIHGLLLVVYHVIGLTMNNRFKQRSFFVNTMMKWLKICLFFHIIVFTWYFFRVDSLDQISAIFYAIAVNSHPGRGEAELLGKLAFYILPVLFFQIIQYVSGDRLVLFNLPVLVRAASYVVVFYLIVIFGVNHAQDFIYFQF